MRRCLIDGNEIVSKVQLHETLASKLQFPEWYGGNLDALHDCLTSISEETVITVINFQSLAENLGRYAKLFVRVIEDSAAENSAVTLNI